MPGFRVQGLRYLTGHIYHPPRRFDSSAAFHCSVPYVLYAATIQLSHPGGSPNDIRLLCSSLELSCTGHRFDCASTNGLWYLLALRLLRC